jgi:hypothetical protein
MDVGWRRRTVEEDAANQGFLAAAGPATSKVGPITDFWPPRGR